MNHYAMLIRKNESYHPDPVSIMTDTAILAASIKTSLLEIARQASGLGVGLQNAAPGDKGSPNNSVQYLLYTSENIAKIAEDCEKLLSAAAASEK